MNILKEKGDGKRLKLNNVFDKKRLLLVFLVACILSSLTTVSVPVHAGHTDEHFWVEPAVKPGEAVDTIFNVSVWIEGAWDVVGWAINVHVDPDVLEVMGASEGPFIKDFVEAWNDANPGNQVSSSFYTGPVDKEGGYIINTDCMILSFENIPDGEAANGTGMLCQYWFKSKSKTAYSPIDLFDARVYDHIGKLYIENVTDGQYNEPPPGAIDGTVTDASTGEPIGGATVTYDGVNSTTDSSGYYIFTDVSVGTYTVTAEMSGYRTASVPDVDVTSGLKTTVNITLTPIATYDFPVEEDEIVFHVVVEANLSVSVSNFTFSRDQKQISFEVTGPSGSVGFCNVIIPKTPKTLLGGVFTVLIDDNSTKFTQVDNATHTSLYFTYELLNTRNVKIQGTEVIPEFPTLAPLLLALAILAVSTIVLKRKPLTKPSTLGSPTTQP